MLEGDKLHRNGNARTPLNEPTRSVPLNAYRHLSTQFRCWSNDLQNLNGRVQIMITTTGFSDSTTQNLR